MSLKLKKNIESVSLNCDLKGTEYMISKFYYCHEGLGSSKVNTSIQKIKKSNPE